MQTKWIYYNHALIPDIAPHETIEIPKFDKKQVGYPLHCSIGFGFRL